jgi:hypothetical protein
MTKAKRKLKAPCLLTTESRNEFVRFRKAVHEDLQPSGPIEQDYVDAAVASMWEISRYRRIKCEILNSAFFEALQKLLQQVMTGFQYHHQRDHAAEDLARRWFADQDVKAEVARLLGQHGLDETAVEAEAFRLRAESIKGMDLLLSAKEIALERALRFLGKLRKTLGERLRRTGKEILETEPDPDVLTLVEVSKSKA